MEFITWCFCPDRYQETHIHVNILQSSLNCSILGPLLMVISVPLHFYEEGALLSIFVTCDIWIIKRSVSCCCYLGPVLLCAFYRLTDCFW